MAFVSLPFVSIADLIRIQVSRMKSEWYDEIEVTIYICATSDAAANCNAAEATDAQTDVVCQKLTSAEVTLYVANIYEGTKEETYENFQRLNGNDTLTQWTTPGMLQFAFHIKLVNPEQYSVVKEEFSGTAGVSEARDQREIVEPLPRVLGAARTTALDLGVIVAVVTILLISTTTRLSAMGREQGTQIMHYADALNLFIQAPFIIGGALAVLAGATFTIGTLFVGVHFTAQGWMALSFRWMNFIGMGEVAIMMSIPVLVAIALATIASAFSFAKYMKA